MTSIPSKAEAETQALLMEEGRGYMEDAEQPAVQDSIVMEDNSFKGKQEQLISTTEEMEDAQPAEQRSLPIQGQEDSTDTFEGQIKQDQSNKEEQPQSAKSDGSAKGSIKSFFFRRKATPKADSAPGKPLPTASLSPPQLSVKRARSQNAPKDKRRSASPPKRGKSNVRPPPLESKFIPDLEPTPKIEKKDRRKSRGKSAGRV